VISVAHQYPQSVSFGAYCPRRIGRARAGLSGAGNRPLLKEYRHFYQNLYAGALIDLGPDATRQL